MINQVLTVKPGGVFASGSISFFLDPATGVINYNASVLDIMGGNHALNGALKFDPKLLLSASVKPGEVFKTASFGAEVKSINGKVAQISISGADGSSIGQAVVLLNQEYIWIQSAMVQLSGYAITLEG